MTKNFHRWWWCSSLLVCAQWKHVNLTCKFSSQSSMSECWSPLRHLRNQLLSLKKENTEAIIWPNVPEAIAEGDYVLRAFEDCATVVWTGWICSVLTCLMIPYWHFVCIWLVHGFALNVPCELCCLALDHSVCKTHAMDWIHVQYSVRYNGAQSIGSIKRSLIGCSLPQKM